MKFDKKYIIQIFLIHIYKKLIIGEDMPSLKFIFNDDAFKLFEEVKNNPAGQNKYDKINDYMIQYIKDNNYAKDNEISINIDNANLFFDKLTELIDLYGSFEEKYDGYTNYSFLTREYLSIALWLRMNPEDFYNVYNFLDRQISFLKNANLFDDIYRDGSISRKHLDGEYYNYQVVSSIDNNTIWYETYQKMIYELIDLDNGLSYKLPSIHFGIDDGKVCYIYGIQNQDGEHDKKIERSLYKINAGIDNPNIHPSFILAMKMFIQFLASNNITNIKVPLLEVLNYDYHIKMSEHEKKRFEANWPEDYIQKIINEKDEYEIHAYEEDKKITSKFIDKEDDISKAKVENLANIFIRIQEQFDFINCDVEDYMLNVKIKPKEIQNKQI